MQKKFNRALVRVFHVFAVGWMVVVVLITIVSIVGLFISEPSFYHGWKRVCATLSPFNIGNTICIFILSLPAIIAFKCKEYFAKKLEHGSQ